jgi:GAF domain-containing protein
MSDMVAVSQEFAGLGAELHGDGDNDEALARVVQLAVKHIEACIGASITLRRAGGGRSLATSDPIAQHADQLQYALNEGPCLQSAADETPHILFDVEGEQRWPRYAAALLAETPVRSVLSFPLPAAESAALNLFADHAGAFTGNDIDLATVLAAHTSSLIALYEAEEAAAHLEVALDSNREIGTAIGILMAYHKVTREDAFLLLRSASQHLHVKLRDVAADLVETGTLPEEPPPSGR